GLRGLLVQDALAERLCLPGTRLLLLFLRATKKPGFYLSVLTLPATDINHRRHADASFETAVDNMVLSRWPHSDRSEKHIVATARSDIRHLPSECPVAHAKVRTNPGRVRR